MFWKKKISDTPLIEHENSNRRMSFRLDTDEDHPVFAEFGDQRVRMRNISAGGLSFDFDRGRIGDTRAILITLPGRKGFSFSGQAEILTLSESCTCHCRLFDISDDVREQIHQYVLCSQVLRQRKRRWARLRPPCDQDDLS